ncbi:uncharacterized protein LOC129758247 [Uranotaenia lowii]|uniref:uncharacterized protein LOC129758247 n=1 Tax=Uranotaenia lowii TaxID=190385 RepID=UPI002479A958|nr:uncharacterized protein LOC129758247 [Uranotaenia lowii]
MLQHLSKLVTLAAILPLIVAQCDNPPTGADPRACCNCPRVLPPRDQFVTCMQKIPMPSGPPPAPGTPPPGANCMAECVLEQMGIITGGALSKDAAQSKVNSIMGSAPEWVPIAQKVVDSCYAKVSGKLSEKDSNGCSVAAGSFMECLPTDMFINCPASSWTASGECEAIKTYLNKGCTIMGLMRGPPPF